MVIQHRLTLSAKNKEQNRKNDLKQTDLSVNKPSKKKLHWQLFSERTSGGGYHHGYIRKILTAAAVVTACYCWPALVGALGTGAVAGALA